MKGTSYFKPPEGSGGRPVAVPTEYWLDLANGRWKMTWPGYGGGPGVFEVSIEEKSCDGGDREIVMNHNAKTFYYNRISEFQRKLFCLRHTKQLVNRAIGNPELYDSYRNVGQEEINGQMYDIWEVVEQQQGYIPGLKMRSWLSPQTGEFAKVITWIQNRDGTWQKRSEIESVERNIEMGDEIFPTRPPRGYKLQNPRFRPKSSGLGSVLSINYSTQIILAMPDGSIIVCWSCEDKDSRQSQESFFSKNFPLKFLLLKLNIKDRKSYMRVIIWPIHRRRANSTNGASISPRWILIQFIMTDCSISSFTPTTQIKPTATFQVARALLSLL
jgi:hypothetical protein